MVIYCYTKMEFTEYLFLLMVVSRIIRLHRILSDNSPACMTATAKKYMRVIFLISMD